MSIASTQHYRLLNPAFARTAFAAALWQRLEQASDSTSTRILYKGRNTVWADRIADVEIVVKQYRRPSKLQSLLYRVRSPKARRAFINGMMLQRSHLPTPEPIAALETYSHGRLLRSFSVTRHYPQESTARQHLHGNSPLDRQRMAVCAHLLAQFHQRGFLHQDWSPGNILFDSKGNPAVVDLNRMRFGRSCRWWRYAALVRMSARDQRLRHYAYHYAQAMGEPNGLRCWRWTCLLQQCFTLRNHLKTWLRPWKRKP